MLAGSKVLSLNKYRCQRLAERLIDDVFLFARRQVDDATLARAFDTFWGDGEDGVPVAGDDASMGRFFDWFVFDYRPGGRGRTVLERFLARVRHLADEDRQVLESWRGSRLGLYEVLVRSEEGDLLLEDVFTGARHRCWDRVAARNLHRFDLVFTRLLPVGDQVGLSVAGLSLPRWWKGAVVRRLGEALREYRRRKRNAGWEEFFRQRAHEVHRILSRGLVEGRSARFQTLSGEECLLSRAWFVTGDREEVARALSLRPELQGAGERAWYWFAAPGEGLLAAGRILLGTVVLRGGLLTLECLSRERLERGKALLQGWLSGLVEHRLDEYRTFSLAGPGLLGAANAALEEAPPATPGLASLQQGWLDEPAPALGGLTPRQACQTRDGRARLSELLRVIENLEEKKRRAGRPYVDVEALRRELNLLEEW